MDCECWQELNQAAMCLDRPDQKKPLKIFLCCIWEAGVASEHDFSNDCEWGQESSDHPLDRTGDVGDRASQNQGERHS